MEQTGREMSLKKEIAFASSPKSNTLAIASEGKLLLLKLLSLKELH